MRATSKRKSVDSTSSDSDIQALTPESESTKSQSHETKKSWVWQYFKTEAVENISYNVCQANRVLGGSAPCLKRLAVDKKGSTKSMSNHLIKCHGLESDGKSSNLGSIKAFIKTGQAPKKLTRDTLTAAVARFFITSNIPHQVVDHDNFTELLRLCNPLTKFLLCGKDTLAAFIRTAFQQGQQAL